MATYSFSNNTWFWISWHTNVTSIWKQKYLIAELEYLKYVVDQSILYFFLNKQVTFVCVSTVRLRLSISKHNTPSKWTFKLLRRTRSRRLHFSCLHKYANTLVYNALLMYLTYLNLYNWKRKVNKSGCTSWCFVLW